MAMIRSMLKTNFKNTLCAASVTSACRRSLSSTAQDTKTKEQLEQEISNYYGNSAKGNYERLFGNNRHFGYFPHLNDPAQPKLDFREGGSALTQHMARIAGIDSNSRVIDFGCGAGQPIFEICQSTGCQGLGVDLTPEHIEVAKEKYCAQCDGLDYKVASVTSLPEEIRNGPKFSHVFTTQVICHMARFSKDVLREAHAVLEPNGILVIDDFVQSESGVSQKAKDYFFERLHFEPLQTFADYAQGLTEAGFDIVSFENATQHMGYGYEIIAPLAAEAGAVEYDGQPLAKHYEETSQCCYRGEIGMVVIVARKQ